ncbi:hypothetical protein PoB_003935500 [Plakobranchus ocellatus]|uniref:Uncharacterized protein n=1 Tax=Plakobranchus ocellatus TaxID=259542 RepID=A0AAV4AWU9_9GAST|nr:hypothetical protein PoB_003935500 [Plakobranchus ocellatus]
MKRLGSETTLRKAVEKEKKSASIWTLYNAPVLTPGEFASCAHYISFNQGVKFVKQENTRSQGQQETDTCISNFSWELETTQGNEQSENTDFFENFEDMEMPPELNVAQIPEILEESRKSYSGVIERNIDQTLMRIPRALEAGATSTRDYIHPNFNDRETCPRSNT